MADIARTKIRWLRKRHPVNSADAGGGARAVLEAGVRVTNAGDVDWTESPPWQVRGHLVIAGGAYHQDPAVRGAILPDPVPAGATVDLVVEFLSDPFTAGLTPAELFHPDTLVIVDVVHEGVGWLGEEEGGSPGQRYVREAIRDTLSGDSFDGDVARACMLDRTRGDVAVPTSGPDLDVVFVQVPEGETHYVTGLTVVATGDSVQRLAFRQTRPGDPEQHAEDWVVAPDAPFPSHEFRPRRRFDPGDQYRITVAPNPDSGTVSASLERIVLPWEEEF